MRRAFLFGPILAAVIAGSASGAATVGWDGLPYFIPTLNQALITTDGNWTGADAVKTPPALSAGPAPVPFDKLGRSFIWAPSCGQAAERRTFSQRYVLPGAPIRGTFNFAYGPARERPYESATLTVNGVVVARLGKTAGFPLGKGAAPMVFGDLSPAARRAFRHGANLVRIDVSRAALKPGQRCTDAKLPRYVGVVADIFLQFGGDLKVRPPRVPVAVKKDVTNGQSVGVQGTATFTNGGPSTAIAGTVEITIGGPGASAIQDLGVSAPLYGCVREVSRLSCKYRDFRAGQTATIQFIGGTKVNTGFFRGGVDRILTLVSIQTPSNFPDPNGLNNSQKSETILCVAGATDPACK